MGAAVLWMPPTHHPTELHPTGLDPAGLEVELWASATWALRGLRQTLCWVGVVAVVALLVGEGTPVSALYLDEPGVVLVGVLVLVLVLVGVLVLVVVGRALGPGTATACPLVDPGRPLTASTTTTRR